VLSADNEVHKTLYGRVVAISSRHITHKHLGVQVTRIGFLLFYLLGMIPTYILPYFGSNSVVAQTATALVSGSGFGLTGTVLHAGALLSLIYVAWARSKVSGKTVLIAFPVVAAVFDLVPILSAIPLVPTVLHVIALVQGFSGPDEAESELDGLAARPLMGLLGIYGVTVVAAIAMFVSGMGATARHVESFGSTSRAAALADRVSADNAAARTRLEAQRSTRDVNASLFGTGEKGEHAATVGIFGSDTQANREKLANMTGAPAHPAHADVPAPVTHNDSFVLAPSSQSAATPTTPVAPPAAPDLTAQLQANLTQREQQAAQDRANQSAKDAALFQHVAQINEVLARPATLDMARKYAESYLGFVQAGDTRQAMTIFGANPYLTSGFVQDGRNIGGISRFDVHTVKFSPSLSPRLVGKISVTFALYGNNTSLGHPDRTFYMTLDDSGSKFIAAY